MRIPYPVPGTNPGFDRIYGEKDAVRLVFGRAFERWIEGFPGGSIPAPQARYPAMPANVYKAGRAIDASIIAAVRDRIDPLGLRKVGWLAQAIGLSAMSDEMDRLQGEAGAPEGSKASAEEAEPCLRETPRQRRLDRIDPAGT